MAGTHVFYNGVLFRDCEIHEWDQVIETDDSGSTEKYSKIRVTISSTLISIFDPLASPTNPRILMSKQHPSTIQMPKISGETMVDRMEELQLRLQEPRKDFWLAFHACTPDQIPDPEDPDPPLPKTEPSADPGARLSYRLALAATGIRPANPGSNGADEKLFAGKTEGGGDVFLDVRREDVFDCDNGPKPQGVKVKSVFGGYAVQVIASFEICRVLSSVVSDGPSPNYDAQKAQGLISNKWGVLDSLDGEGRVLHHIKGKATVKDSRYKANAMRLFCFPLAFPYAKLENRRYAVDPTGLVLEYEFTFVHAGAAPPEGVRDFEATYYESVHGGSHGTKYAGMKINVNGYHHRDMPGVALLDREKVQKRLLHRALYAILYARIRGISKQWVAEPGRLLPGQDAKNVLLKSGRVTERVGLPNLEMDVEVEYGGEDDTEFLHRLENMGEPFDIPAYDPRWWPIDNEFGRVVGEDKDNPNFRNAILPYKADGNPELSDYFDGYHQPPGSRRHTVPRLTGRTSNNALTDTGKEWAEAGGFVPMDAVSPAFPPAGTDDDRYNPTKQPLALAFSAVMYPDLKGELRLAISPPRTALSSEPSFTGVSDVQRSNFMYLVWDSEILHDSDEGVIHLPLSAPREIEKEVEVTDELGNTSTFIKKFKQSAVALRLFPGISKRVYSVTATRMGKWPEVPEPKKEIAREKELEPGPPGDPTPPLNSTILVETLLKKEVVTDTPKLAPDGVNRLFTVHCRWTYGLSIPWGADAKNGGVESFVHSLPVGKSPIDKATQANNEIVLRQPAPPSELEEGEPNPNAVPSVLFDEQLEKYG